MKFNSLLSHFFTLFPDAYHHTDGARKAAADPVDGIHEHQPTLVFLGSRYQKKPSAPNDAFAEIRPQAPRIYRGAPYAPQSMPKKLAGPRRKPILIFRGIEIDAD